jgi:hypothetical protein
VGLPIDIINDFVRTPCLAKELSKFIINGFKRYVGAPYWENGVAKNVEGYLKDSTFQVRMLLLLKLLVRESEINRMVEEDQSAKLIR